MVLTMISVRDRPKPKSALGFAYLRPLPTDVLPATSRQSRRLRRVVNAAFVLFYSATAIGAAWLSGYEAPAPITQTPPAPPAESQLFDYLGSPEYAAFLARYQEERQSRLLAEAEADRVQAAAELESAEHYKVLASYKTSDAILPHSPGEDVKTTTKVSVTCEQTETGYTAVVHQLNEAYRDGIVDNLAVCYAGTRWPGGAIGVAGEYQPSIRD